MTAQSHNPIAAADGAAATAKPPSATVAAPRVRVAFEYAVEGDLRFISHRDEMRVLGRALVRAAWPLRYSRGFNPAPYLSIVLPRSTGMASDCQLALVDLAQRPADREPLAERLAAALPDRMPLRRLFVDDVPLALHPQLVTYECALPPEQAAVLAAELPRLLAAGEPLQIESTRKRAAQSAGNGRPARTLDARPFIDAVELSSGILRLSLRFDGERSARPLDILKAVGLDVMECGHRLRRVSVAWNTVLAGGESHHASPSNRAAQASATPHAGAELSPRAERQEELR